jgi:serine/threonine protein kinase
MHFLTRYFALELCTASLDQLFLPGNDPRKYNGRKPNICEVIYQLAFGLEYIHSKNIVYRDIKPENVLISVDTTSTKITMKWADFGFSKSKSEQGSWSFSGKVVNQTPNWLAPELLDQSYEERTKENTKMSDIFAEGLLFGYFLLKGRHPFGSRFEITRNILCNDKVYFERKTRIFPIEF